MFIASRFNKAWRSGGAQCALVCSLVQLHAAFNGAACVGLMPSYKHIAPPEQSLHEFSTRKTLKRVRRSAKPFRFRTSLI
jgi:hypothetical protein